MAHTEKRRGQDFAGGILILTVSNLLVKAIGLLFKIPMNYIAGDGGMGYYNSAYAVYTLFYMLSTSGLPIAGSVMISEYRADGQIAAAKRVYRLSLALFLTIGAGVAAVMFFGADSLAAWIRSDASAPAIAALSPAILFICITSAVRGYFQGCGNLTPTAVSQLIEAGGKLAVGVTGAAYAVRMGYDAPTVAAYAVCGLTVGSLGGMIFLAVARILRGDRDLMTDSPVSAVKLPRRRDLLRRFAVLSIPVTVSASVMSLTNMMDTVLIQRTLRQTGMGAGEAAALYGNYTSLAVPIFNLPPVFIYPLAAALVPTVAAAFSSGRREEAAEKVGSALRYAVLIGLPASLGMAVMADPLLCLLYRDSSAHLAAPLLTLLSPSAFFVCILAVTNAVLQSCGQERKPVVSMLVGAVVKGVTSALLLRRFGIAGAPLSTFCCYFVSTVLNFRFVIRYTGVRLRFGQTFVKPLLAGLACALTAAGLDRLLAGRIGQSAACLLSIGAAVVVYAGLIVLLGAVTAADGALLTERFHKKGKKLENP